MHMVMPPSQASATTLSQIKTAAAAYHTQPDCNTREQLIQTRLHPAIAQELLRLTLSQALPIQPCPGHHQPGRHRLQQQQHRQPSQQPPPPCEAALPTQARLLTRCSNSFCRCALARSPAVAAVKCYSGSRRPCHGALVGRGNGLDLDNELSQASQRKLAKGTGDLRGPLHAGLQCGAAAQLQHATQWARQLLPDAREVSWTFKRRCCCPAGRAAATRDARRPQSTHGCCCPGLSSLPAQGAAGASVPGVPPTATHGKSTGAAPSCSLLREICICCVCMVCPAAVGQLLAGRWLLRHIQLYQPLQLKPDRQVAFSDGCWTAAVQSAEPEPRGSQPLAAPAAGCCLSPAAPSCQHGDAAGSWHSWSNDSTSFFRLLL